MLQAFLMCGRSLEKRHQTAPVLLRDRKDLECVRLLEQKSDGIQNEFVHDDFVKQPHASYYPPT